MLSLTVVILTFNEEKHILRALKSVAGFAQRIVVVDSHSTDNTVEIARAFGADVLQNKFISHAKQFNWGLDNAAIETDWVMRLDADEIVEGDLAAEIEDRLPAMGAEVVGINLKRKHIFLDRWIRWGGRYPITLLRIWRCGHGRSEEVWVDEHIVCSGGTTVTFCGNLADWNLNNISFFTAKHNDYATREAVSVILGKNGIRSTSSRSKIPGNDRVTVLKRYIKNNIYYIIPFYISTFAYFIYRYFFLLGFLDGTEGLAYHFLQGLWYRFLVGAKVLELEHQLSHNETRESVPDALERLTGLHIR